MSTIIENAYIVTMDAGRREISTGSVVFDGNTITAVSEGAIDAKLRDGAEIVDGTGCVLTPGLINTHHHL